MFLLIRPITGNKNMEQNISSLHNNLYGRGWMSQQTLPWVAQCELIKGQHGRDHKGYYINWVCTEYWHHLWNVRRGCPGFERWKRPQKTIKLSWVRIFRILNIMQDSRVAVTGGLLHKHYQGKGINEELDYGKGF